eukprot:gene7622-779_t
MIVAGVRELLMRTGKPAHYKIKNQKLKEMWADQSQIESMSWRNFKKCFPGEVVELMHELAGDKYEAFKAAVEADEGSNEEVNEDNWSTLMVTELNDAFPEDGDAYLLKRGWCFLNTFVFMPSDGVLPMLHDSLGVEQQDQLFLEPPSRLEATLGRFSCKFANGRAATQKLLVTKDMLA